MTREEEIRQAARKYFDDYMDGLKGEVLTVQQTFEDAAKWADETMIDKFCKWLESTDIDMEYWNSEDGVCTELLIEGIKKAMEL